MSNFTDFFPNGAPVNSYKSFLVNSTNNPTGYDATTGLYTHPNGDFWLKTGKTLSSATYASTYPDATISFVALTTGLQSTSLTGLQSVGYQNPAGSAFGPAFAVVTGYTWQGGQYLTSTWTSGGHASFSNINPPFSSVSIAPGSNNMAVNPSNGTLFTFPYNNAAVMTTIITIPSGTAKGASYEGSLSEFYLTNTAGTIYRYNSSYTLLSTTVTGVAGGAIATNGTNIYLGNSSNTVVAQYTIGATITATGKTFDVGSLSGGIITSVDSLDIYNGGMIVTDSTNSNVVEFTEPANVLGDGTVRTDADSSQPLFVKLK